MTRKAGTPARKSSQVSSTLQDRLKELRLSLDPQFKSEVPMGAMDRVMDLDSRHRWRRAEREGDLRDPVTEQVVMFALKKLAGKLQVEDEDKTYSALEAFVRGEGPLPWEKAPPWKDGCSPMVPVGRPVGARVLGATRVLPPDTDLPTNVPTESLLAQPSLDGANSAPVSNDPSHAALEILEQVRARTIPPEAALRVLKLLIPCRHGTSPAFHHRQ